MTYSLQLFDDIITNPLKDGVLVIQLNRPNEFNALRTKLLDEIAQVLVRAEEDENVRCVVLTGNQKAFAAGADIKEMATKSPVDVLRDPRASSWKVIRNFKKPLIAAVNGYCLGGGNELAMHCDIIVAGENAKFGQPEINLGIIPGAGGTQRFTSLLGKSKAMRYVLTGDFMSAKQAYEAGLVAEIFAPEETLDQAINIAKKIAQKAPIAVELAKEAVLKASDSLLESGLAFERKAFAVLFSTSDQKEGADAFINKRPPVYKGS
ncbi:enoyl-CoA hydratase-related protein [Terasakiella pusilla]|uniref:enoyl-CoA hydratase-related protein n=1 Tax=Terasakiella pusilla TaxID=64973 RepID=UPI003AA89D20